jgi:hypothetical protein
MRDLIRMAGPRLPLPGGVRRTPKPPLVFRTHPTHRVRGSACSTPMNVLIMHSKLDNGPCKRSGNRNGRRHQLIELPQSTPLLVVPARSGWRCWLGVGEAPRRGPSASGSYRFHPRPSAYCDRSRLGHRLGVRSSCQSSSASSATRVNARSTTSAHRVRRQRSWVFTPRLRGIRLLLRGPPCHRLRQVPDNRRQRPDVWLRRPPYSGRTRRLENPKTYSRRFLARRSPWSLAASAVIGPLYPGVTPALRD